MPTNDCASTATQTSSRPTRAAVVLTLAMMVAPLLTLLVSAAGCSRSTAGTTKIEVRGNDESAAARVATPLHRASSRTSSK